MSALEMPAMIAVLILGAAAVGTKVLTTTLLARMNSQISRVAQHKQEALGRLKAAQTQKQVIEKNLGRMKKKKSSTSKKIARLKGEMKGFRAEEKARRKRTEARHVS